MNDQQQLNQLLAYIARGWQMLERSPRQLLQAARDPKLPRQDGPWPVYVSRQENLAAVEERLKGQMPPGDFAQIELRLLPDDPTALQEHGLLYLPHPYVVPGGRFNELYGWDSYWIVVGLLHDGELVLAQNIVDNFLYEIEHYGAVLNANRTYYLTRSQPPLLTGMLLKVYRQTRDRAWLRCAVPAIEKFHRYWTVPAYQHITPTGLSRYYDLGVGPAPEVLGDEKDAQGRTHYERVRDYYRTHPDEPYGYDLARFYDRANDRLTALFYVADRSMRESGFDPSDRFGRFNAGVIDFNPVCLNTLLYLMEQETAEIMDILGEHSMGRVWREQAGQRREQINALLWDAASGLYLDYHYGEGTRRNYPFATTFYPLYAGIASEEQAGRVVANLPLLEAPGGLLTSANESGSQWDAPFGWAPLQMIAVQGLRRYGYEQEASRISLNFLSLVLQEFIRYKAIFEKYDVAARDIGRPPAYGYSENVIGFGWTNGAFLELLAGLPRLPLSGVGVGRPARV